jgi:hypothetical protein
VGDGGVLRGAFEYFAAYRLWCGGCGNQIQGGYVHVQIPQFAGFDHFINVNETVGCID